MSTVLLDGQRAVAARVHVPGRGPWWADVDLEEAAPLGTGQVTLEVPGLTLTGTVVTTGTDNLQRRARVVGGAAGWRRELAARAYHNDASIRARTVIEDAAREAGETLGDVTPAQERLGIDYVRVAGVAARALEDAAGGAAWWVAYDGRTHVGTRPRDEVDADAIEILEYDPRARMVTIAADDMSLVGVGSVLESARLDEAQTVRELTMEITAEQVRVLAWVGGADGSRGRLGDALRGAVARMTEGRIFGLCRYRVGQMSGDRVDLQPVRTGAGLPDLRSVSMVPGVAGAHAELAPAAHVWVAFEMGDPRYPIIVGFAGKDGEGHTPQKLTLDASGVSASLLIGATATKAPAWAPEVRAELAKIATALTSAVAPTGGGSLTWAPGTNYVAPVADSAIGAAKTRCA